MSARKLSLVTLKPAYLARDGFNDADAASLGNAETGQAWREVNGTWGITGGAAYVSVSAVDNIADLDSGLANVWVGVTVITTATARRGGVAWRVTDNNNHYWARLNASTNVLSVYKRSGGGYTLLDEVAFTMAASQQYRVNVLVVGNVHKIYVDGVLYITATDPEFSTVTRHGLYDFNGLWSYNDFYVRGI